MPQASDFLTVVALVVIVLSTLFGLLWYIDTRYMKDKEGDE